MTTHMPTHGERRPRWNLLKPSVEAASQLRIWYAAVVVVGSTVGTMLRDDEAVLDLIYPTAEGAWTERWWARLGASASATQVRVAVGGLDCALFMKVDIAVESVGLYASLLVARHLIRQRGCYRLAELPGLAEGGILPPCPSVLLNLALVAIDFLAARLPWLPAVLLCADGTLRAGPSSSDSSFVPYPITSSSGSSSLWVLLAVSLRAASRRSGDLSLLKDVCHVLPWFRIAETLHALRFTAAESDRKG